jgi:large conductance mechanosensitive channel
MLKEFKDFVSRGNMLDLAIGVVIGAAFGKVTEGFMNFIVNPLIGLIGGTDLSDKFVVIGGRSIPEVMAANTLEEVKQAGGSALGYGAFISSSVNFLIVAFVMFLFIKAYNKFKHGEAEAVLAAPPDVAVLIEIRDILASK